MGHQEFFSTILVHLLNLVQYSTAGYLPTLWTYLESAKKHHQLTALQRSLNDTSLLIRIRTPIVVSLTIMCITMELSTYLEEKEDLITGLHPFVLE